MASKLLVKGVLFDLDGVIVDSHAAVDRHWHEFAAWYGLDSNGLALRALGRKSIDTIERELAHLSHDEIKDAEQRFYELEEMDTEGVTFVPGVRDFIAALPIDRWAVVTSCGRRLAEARMREVGLAIPERLITADDVTHGKPSPEGYLAGAALMGVEARSCVVFEDAPPGLRAAMAAGATPVAVATGTPGDELQQVLGADGTVIDNFTGVAVRTEGEEIILTFNERQA